MTIEDAWKFAAEAADRKEWDRLLILCDALEENGEVEAAQTLRWFARKGSQEWTLTCGEYTRPHSWVLRDSNDSPLTRGSFVHVVEQMGMLRSRILEVFGD